MVKSGACYITGQCVASSEQNNRNLIQTLTLTLNPNYPLKCVSLSWFLRLYHFYGLSFMWEGNVSWTICISWFATLLLLYSKFCDFKKSIDKMLISEDLSYFKNFCRFFRKDRKNVTKFLENACKIKLQAWPFTSRTSLYGCPQNKWLLLIKVIFCSFDVWFCVNVLIKFKVECAFK